MEFQRIHDSLDYYKKFIPTNYQEELEKFLKLKNRDKSYNPMFKYEDAYDYDDYRSIIDYLEKIDTQDKTIVEFIDLYKNVAKMVTAWKRDDYEALTMMSGGIFGSIENLNQEKAIEIYKEVRERSGVNSQKKYSSEQIGARFLKEFKRLGLLDWKVEYNGMSGSEVSVYELERKIVIKKNTYVSRLMIDRILCHEIEAHAFQSLNAMVNTKYKDWFTAYLGTELQYEGFAIFTEVNNLNQACIDTALERYLLFMIATSIALRSDFNETYNKIFELCNNEHFSFFTAYKAKRGFRDTSRTGCFQKENSYLLGAMEIIDLVNSDDNNYDKLLSGCFPLSATKHVRPGHVVWRGTKEFNKENLDYFSGIIKNIFN